MIKQVKIYDMDGTIVDSTHRYRTIDNKIDLQYWRDNSHKAYNDSLLPLSEQYFSDIRNPEIYVIIATARVLNAPDMAFIQDKLGMPDKIISRRDNDDNRRGTDLKIQGLRYINNLKQFNNAEITFYEDNVEYLKGVCDYFNCTGVYIPSKQGH